jgi:3-phosphoinositide dependent protein kinase-1
MKRRHPNIDNEILMEKRALNKLEHPNIVPLYATFQDYGTLYFQMEFLSGGELWKCLHDSLSANELDCSVGYHESLVLFYIAECINAVEYMHRKGIVHRDIKPENIMLTAEGCQQYF